ncbi:MAG TPA: ATP-binding cassette domain-containing protein [Bacillota bacterium]|nr:ATP-binding cassette domain-containing protein [Bacillota bacterium]
MEILTVENLSFTYPGCDSAALENVSFSIERGDFLVVAGATGSGKSTLLKTLKPALTPLGEKTGTVRLCGKDIYTLPLHDTSRMIGFVMQRPEMQITTDMVWHELAFGLENLGVPQDEMRRRVSEMACYFGIEEWFDKKTCELSGGQKQLLNLASVMVMQPDVLILDEPTSQLDPIAASSFIATLSKLNRELSLTVILVEHSLEEALPISDKLLALRNGKVLAFGETKKAVETLRADVKMLESMPSAVRLYCAVNGIGACPLDVREGRAFIENNFSIAERTLPLPEYDRSDEKALEFHDVFFRYSRELPDVLHGLELTVCKGEIFTVLGGNGSGKSTALCCAAGLNAPFSGRICVFGKKIKEYKNGLLYKNCVAMLPQDVQTVFLKNTVREELEDVGTDGSELPFDLKVLYEKHPYDLSGGEMQLVALAKVLASKPKLLLLDEPTKGLDAYSKKEIIRVLRALKASGMTLVIVTHDVELAAVVSDRCAMLFRGEVTSSDVPRRFFAGNSFYTTAISRMTRGLFADAVTVEDAGRLCLMNGRCAK